MDCVRVGGQASCQSHGRKVYSFQQLDDGNILRSARIEPSQTRAVCLLVTRKASLPLTNRYNCVYTSGSGRPLLLS